MGIAWVDAAQARMEASLLHLIVAWRQPSCRRPAWVGLPRPAREGGCVHLLAAGAA